MTIDERFDRMDERLDRMERSIGELTQNLKTLSELTQQNFKSLTQYVLDFRTETANRFQNIEIRLDVLGASVSSLDVRMVPLTKAIIDFGAVTSQLQREQARLSTLVDPAA